MAFLSLVGELDLATASILEDWVSMVESGDATTIVFDLEELRFMDASGLRVFLGVGERARRTGRAFRVVNASAAVRRLLEMTGTTHLFDLDGAPVSPLPGRLHAIG